MFFTRNFAVFCAVALLLALGADASFVVLSRILGGVGIFAKPSGWLLMFSVFWILSLAIGLYVARILHVFPFSS